MTPKEHAVGLMEEFFRVPVPPGAAAYAYLGQHSFLFKFGDVVVGCDLFLTPFPDRLIPPLLTPDEASRPDLILGSHDHADHIDRPLWREIVRRRPNALFILPEAVQGAVASEPGLENARLAGLRDGQTMEAEGVRVTGVAAAHEFLDVDPRTGAHPYLGYILEANGVRVYHAGDCCLYPGLHERLANQRFDAVFLPINGRDARRLKSGCIGNMTYQEAADLAGWLWPGLTVPTHFDMFAMNSENPDLFLEYMAVKYPTLRAERPIPGEIRVIHSAAI